MWVLASKGQLKHSGCNTSPKYHYSQLSSVAYPPFDFPTMPASDCCSRCWQAIFNCFKLICPSVKYPRDGSSSETSENDFIKRLPKLDSWHYQPPVGSAFPARLDKDLEHSSDNTSSETAENDFIKGLPKDDSWDYELKQP
ncbi:unnamed protein product [Rodentolepis nana]|uniref:AGC-kinase C-terminal domain-containing protein n=1 Tax=Rodentolepis nana TaxID=102285 RepID=A0A0R3TKL2_RODNA|nr:unnamed protein product [Rodentolepis nana]